MLKKRSFIFFLGIFIYYSLYIGVLYVQSDFWGNILSPVGALIAFTIIIFSYINTKFPEDSISSNWWTLIALGCFSWAIGDLLWALFYFVLKTDPGHNFAVAFTYFLTNLFFTMGTGLFFISKLYKWNRIQLLLDVLVTAAVSQLLILNVFFRHSFDDIYKLIKTDIISFLSIFCDFFILNIIIIWYISNRRGSLHKSAVISFISLILYLITDLVYFYLHFYNLYIPNSIIDGIYMFSLLMLALGAYTEKNEIEQGTKVNYSRSSENIGKSFKFILFLTAPLIDIYFSGFKISDLLLYMSIISVYLLLNSCVQKAINNQ